MAENDCAFNESLSPPPRKGSGSRGTWIPPANTGMEDASSPRCVYDRSVFSTGEASGGRRKTNGHPLGCPFALEGPVKIVIFEIPKLLVNHPTGLLAGGASAPYKYFRPRRKSWRRRNSFPPSIEITGGWSRPLGGGTQNKRQLQKQLPFVLVREAGLEPARP